MSENSPALWQNRVSNEELDRLEALLEDPIFDDAVLSIDEIQGYLCAVLSGPSPINPSNEDDWLIDILGSEEIAHSVVGQEASNILRRFADALKENLAAGEPPLLLLYPSAEALDDSDYAPWCNAYLSAIDASNVDWFEHLIDLKNDEESEEIQYLDERLFSLMVLTGEAETAAREAGEDWPEGEELTELIEDCKGELAYTLVDIYAFWAAIRQPETVRNASPKVGRNDPCSCGSGEKFKHCCGDV